MRENSRRCFVDTNIFVYAHDITAGPKRIRASELIIELWESGMGCTSSQVLQEFHTVITKKVKTPLSLEHSAEIINHLCEWTMHSPTGKDILQGIYLQKSNKLSFWDAMIIQSALEPSRHLIVDQLEVGDSCFIEVATYCLHRRNFGQFLPYKYRLYAAVCSLFPSFRMFLLALASLSW